MAFLLLKGRTPWADVHQKLRQTTNRHQKPSTETDLLTQGKLKHSSSIELPSYITRGWLQTPLQLPWGHPSSLPRQHRSAQHQVSGSSSLLLLTYLFLASGEDVLDMFLKELWRRTTLSLSSPKWAVARQSPAFAPALRWITKLCICLSISQFDSASIYLIQDEYCRTSFVSWIPHAHCHYFFHKNQ